MPGLTDEKSALIAMSHAMGKVTEQMGRLAVSAGVASRALEEDFTQQFARFHWAVGAMFDTLPFGKGHGSSWGGGNNSQFSRMESSILGGGHGNPFLNSLASNNGGRGPLGGMFDFFKSFFIKKPQAEIKVSGLLNHVHYAEDKRPIPPVDIVKQAKAVTSLIVPQTVTSLIVPKPQPRRFGYLAAPPVGSTTWIDILARYMQHPLSPEGKHLPWPSKQFPISPPRLMAPPEEYPLYQMRPKKPPQIAPIWQPAGRGKKGLLVRRYHKVKKLKNGKLIPFSPKHEVIEDANFRVITDPIRRLLGPRSDSKVIIPYVPPGNKSLIPYQYPLLTYNAAGAGAVIDPSKQVPPLVNDLPYPRRTNWVPYVQPPNHRAERGPVIIAKFGQQQQHHEPYSIEEAFFTVVPGRLKQMGERLLSIWTSSFSKIGSTFSSFGRGIVTLFKNPGKLTGGFGSILQNTGERIRAWNYSDVGESVPASNYRSGGGSRPMMPPSMRPRKWNEMGTYTDFYSHMGAEWATGYLMSPLIKHGTPGMYEGMGKLHAHLQGSREMRREEYVELYKQARSMKDEKGKRLFSDKYLEKLGAASAMSRNKYNKAEKHVARLYEEGKLGGVAETERSIDADRKRTEALKNGTTKQEKFNEWLHTSAQQFAKFSLQYGGTALESASPDAFATLTGSFKLLSATIGSELVPFAAAASLEIQHFAKWLGSLDKQKQAWVGLGSAMGVAVGAAFLLAPQLLAVGRIFVAMGGVKLASKLAHAGGGYLGPIVGTAVGTAAAWYMAYKHVENSIKENQQTNFKQEQEKENNSTPNKLMQTEFYKNLKPLTEKTGNAEIDENRMGTLHNRVNDQVQGLNKKIQADAVRLRYLTRDGWSTFWSSDEIEQRQNSMSENSSKLRQVKDIERLLIDGKDKFTDKKKEGNPDYGKKKDDQIMAAAPLLQALRSRVQPAYYGIEDMYKKIQLSVLGESPLDEEIRRIQLDQLDKLSQGNGLLEQMVRSLHDALGMTK